MRIVTLWMRRGKRIEWDEMCVKRAKTKKYVPIYCIFFVVVRTNTSVELNLRRTSDPFFYDSNKTIFFCLFAALPLLLLSHDFVLLSLQLRELVYSAFSTEKNEKKKTRTGKWYGVGCCKCSLFVPMRIKYEFQILYFQTRFEFEFTSHVCNEGTNGDDDADDVCGRWIIDNNSTCRILYITVATNGIPIRWKGQQISVDDVYFDK